MDGHDVTRFLLLILKLGILILGIYVIRKRNKMRAPGKNEKVRYVGKEPVSATYDPVPATYDNVDYAPVDCRKNTTIVMILSILGVVIAYFAGYKSMEDYIFYSRVSTWNMILHVLEPLVELGLLWVVFSTFFRRYKPMWNLGIYLMLVRLLMGMLDLVPNYPDPLFPDFSDESDDVLASDFLGLVLGIVAFVLMIIMYRKSKDKYSSSVRKFLLYSILSPIVFDIVAWILLLMGGIGVYGYSITDCTNPLMLFCILLDALGAYLPYFYAYKIMASSNGEIVPVDKAPSLG